MLYMIRTGKLPAEKEGKAFKIPTNYKELITEVSPRKKRVSKKAAVKGKPGRPKKEQGKKELAKSAMPLVSKDTLVNNLVKVIQDLVEFQIGAVLGKKK